jgi:hypothetical protein
MPALSKKMKRCPNGSRRNKSGKCAKKGLPNPNKKKRCPNGSRRNKSGECAPTHKNVSNLIPVEVAEDSEQPMTQAEKEKQFELMMKFVQSNKDKYEHDKEEFFAATHLSPGNSVKSKTPIIMVNTHGSFSVDAQGNPKNFFKAPIKVFLYRSAQASCLNYNALGNFKNLYNALQKIDTNAVDSSEVNSVLNQHFCTQITHKLGHTADMTLTQNNQAIKMYTTHCVAKVKVIKYNKGDTIINKSFSVTKVPNHVDNLTGVHVVSDLPYLAKQNLLLPIKTGVNSYSMKQIIETAEEAGATECHIVDLGCSAFYESEKQKYLTPKKKHIKAWKKLNYGGR